MQKTNLIQLQTSACDLLGCQYPIVLAGMGGVSRSSLVASVTNAGAYGFLGMVREPPEKIKAEIRQVRAKTNKAFGVNIIPSATDPDLLEKQIKVCIEEKISSVCLFWDINEDVIKRFKDSGITVVYQVGSKKEAEEAQAAGVDLLIAQGVEAGGHVRGKIPLKKLISTIRCISDVPVLAAGGIVNGNDLAEILIEGAQGVVMGTAFLTTTESFAHDYHKQQIIASDKNATILTDLYHINWPVGAYTRVLQKNATISTHIDKHEDGEDKVIIGYEEGRPIYLYSTDSPLMSTTGDLEAMAIYAGKGAYRIDKIESADAKVECMVNEAQKYLSEYLATQHTEPEVNELSSSPCYASEVNNEYMGYDSEENMSINNENNISKANDTDICPSDPNDWESIHHWRKSKRELLIRARLKIGSKNRKQCLQVMQSRMTEILSSLPVGTIGFYWPFKGEFDFRDLVENLLNQGWKAALPVVVNKETPLEFRLWTPEIKLVPGIWNIPVPEERNILIPTVLIVPLVGFDNNNYRLGYGGGYYDRTIASFNCPPVTIGVGLDLCKLDTIFPQRHDIPMDKIVTVPTFN